MKKVKNKLSHPPSKNNPMNINIELNINSPLISNQNGSNYSKPQKSSYGELEGGLERDDNITKGKRKMIVLDLQEAECEKQRRETALAGDMKAIVKPIKAKIDLLDNKCGYEMKHVELSDSSHEQSEIYLARYQQNSKYMQSGQLVSNHPQLIPPLPLKDVISKSKILDKHSLGSLHSSLTTCKYKSELKTKHTKQHIYAQSKTHRKGTSQDLRTIIASKTQQKHGKRTECKIHKKQQENLKAKLQKFKIDILKLGATYEQSQIYKSRVSNEYENESIYNKNIKNQSYFKCEAEQQQKIKEMINFQRHYEAQPSSKDDERHSQTSKQNETGELSINTLDLINYYSKYILNQNNHIDQGQSFSLLSTIRPVQVGQKLSKNVYALKQESSLLHNQHKQSSFQVFMKFLQTKKSGLAKSTIELLEQYARQFQKQQRYDKNRTFPQEKDNKQKHDQAYNTIDNDIDITKQLQVVLQTKTKLSKQFPLTIDNLEVLEDWEYRYRQDLLKLKRKMWSEYKVIKQIVNYRINQGLPQKKQKSSRQLMKCLSESYISCQLSRDESSSEQTEYKPSIQLKLLKQPEQVFSTLTKEEYLPTFLHEQHSEQDSINTYDDLLGMFHQPSSNNLERESQSWKSSNQNEIKIDIEQSFDEENHPLPLMVTQFQKDQLFQFIFIELILQLYNQATQREKLRKKNDKTLAAMSRIKNTIKYYIQQSKIYRNNKKKIGFSTNLNAVSAIASKLSDLVAMDIYINDSPLTIRQLLLKNLNTPIGPSDKQILSSLRYDIYLNQPIISSSCSDEMDQCQILTTPIFLQFQHNIIKIKQLTFERYYQNQDRQKERVIFLRNSVHIYHKAIFDCLNQVLDDQRLYGIWGKPFVWTAKPFFGQQIYDGHLLKILEYCKTIITNNCRYACGLILDKEQSLIKDFANQPTLVNELRTQRAHKMLQNYNEELDSKWFFIDDDQAEISLEVTHLIWRELIHQVTYDIKKLIP